MPYHPHAWEYMRVGGDGCAWEGMEGTVMEGANKIRTSCHRGMHQTDDKTDGEKSEAPNLKYISSE